MIKIEYEDIKFEELTTIVKARFLKYYHFDINKEELERIGKYTIKNGTIEVDASEKTVTNKFNRILHTGLANLKTENDKDVIYIHQETGIPLIGTNEFGIVDRNTSLIEVKPHSSCNLNCVYCSVDAGKISRKTNEFVIEEGYLVSEFKKVAQIKKHPIEASINPQGEPLMYSRITELVKDLKAVKGVKIVSMNSNGLLLTKELIDELSTAGLDRINISMNTANKVTATKLAGGAYDTPKLKEMINYAQTKFEILIAPLIIPGYNDSEIGTLIEFCKQLTKMPRFGFQNFLEYKKGRNPTKSKSMEWFMELLKENEKKYDVRLINTKEDFDIQEDEKIPKPYKKGKAINAKVIMPGKYNTEWLCVSEDRCITVNGYLKIGDEVRLRIVRDKHNIYKATVI